jgi:hypothetical protein
MKIISKINSDQLNKYRNHILSLKDNWDGEGSIGYKEDTWNKAQDILNIYSTEAILRTGQGLIMPAILPGPDGGIDLHFTSLNKTCLIYVPATDSSIQYYADTDDKKIILKGIAKPEEIDTDLLSFLMNM